MVFLKKISPPPEWKPIVALFLGIIAGFSIYMFYISQAWSYVSDKPETCVNCHIMAPQYATWIHSAHRGAVCNDCHVPHNNVFNKYFFKAKDGLRHATMFTLRLEPQVIFIKEAGREVVQNNCLRCHQHTLERLKETNLMSSMAIDNRNCWDCHRETPHGRVNSLSAVPFARVPMLTSPVPGWLKNVMHK